MRRRRFVNWFLGLSGTALLGSVLYPVWRFVNPPDVPEASTNRVEAGPTNDPELLERGFKILEFGNETIEKLQEDIARAKGFRLVSHRHELYGVCADCVRAKEGG